MFSGSSELPMWLTDGFLVTFLEGGWGQCAYTLLMCGGDIHMWELLMCGGDIHVWDLLTCGGEIHMCGTSHQSEILHSLIFCKLDSDSNFWY